MRSSTRRAEASSLRWVTPGKSGRSIPRSPAWSGAGTDSSSTVGTDTARVGRCAQGKAVRRRTVIRECSRSASRASSNAASSETSSSLSDFQAPSPSRTSGRWLVTVRSVTPGLAAISLSRSASRCRSLRCDRAGRSASGARSAGSVPCVFRNRSLSWWSPASGVKSRSAGHLARPRTSYGSTRRPAPARTPPRTAGLSGSCRGRVPPAAGRRPAVGLHEGIRREDRAEGDALDPAALPLSRDLAGDAQEAVPGEDRAAGEPGQGRRLVVGAGGGRAVQIADQQVADPARHGQDRRCVVVRLQALVRAIALHAREAGDLAAGDRLAGVQHAEPHRDRPHRLGGLQQGHVQPVVDRR
ncbi:hypothetical protein SMICM17S_08634 [Streptomyces microflavus]